MLEPDLISRALAGAPSGMAVAAGRWDDQAGFALLASIEVTTEGALLCALRHTIPFDAVELASARAAAELLALSIADGRAVGQAQRDVASSADRLALHRELLRGLEEARDVSTLLARAADEIATRMGAAATSIMLVEGDTLRLRASVGLPPEIALGYEQPLDEGIAGWVATSGEAVRLRGPVAEARFQGSDPNAGEAIILPLRAKDRVLGVLNVKRPTGELGFDEKVGVLETMANDLGVTLRAVGAIAGLEREHRAAIALADATRSAAAGDPEAAVRRVAEGLGHDAVAVRGADGRILGVHAKDEPSREAALGAAARVAPAGPGSVRVGFARERRYEGEDAGEAARATDTLAFLGRAEGVVSARPGEVLRVLAVEDHPVMRLGVQALLEREGLIVAGITATCAEAIDLVLGVQPDVVLLDLSLPDASGAEAVVRLRAVAPAVPIVAFSIERAPDVIRAVLRGGANGYVSKEAPAAQVAAALRAAAAGLAALGSLEALALSRPEPVAPPETAEEHAENGEPAEEVVEPAAIHEPLTPRELELLRYLAEGYTNKEIARAMVLAEDTVKKGVQTLIAKLGATDRTHAVVLALRRRLIE